MNRQEFINSFFNAVITQNAEALQNYFTKTAYIRWNNTNEQFTPEEYIIANCEYPGSWCGEIQRYEQLGNLTVTVARVWLSDKSISFHVTSFFEFDEDKISILNEYWGDDGNPPQWRVNKNIGREIK